MVNFIKNRSVPTSSVIPVLVYEDLNEIVDWLCNAFGFKKRLQIGNHRAQLVMGDGAIIVTQNPNKSSTNHNEKDHFIHVRVENVDLHYKNAVAHNAQIIDKPINFPYSERQYTAVDPGGHNWTFSQSIADVDPESWGAILYK